MKKNNLAKNEFFSNKELKKEQKKLQKREFKKSQRPQQKWAEDWADALQNPSDLLPSWQIWSLQSKAHKIIIPAFLFVITLILYAYTAPPTVTLEDDGLFIMSSYFWGVAHAPGYPLHTMLGKLFSLLPVGTVAYRIHLLSGVLASLSLVALYQLMLFLLKNPLISFLSALALACSKTFWSQSIISEVYTFNVLFTLLLITFALKWRPQSPAHYSYLFCLVGGTSLSNHWPLIGLCAPGILFLLMTKFSPIDHHELPSKKFTLRGEFQHLLSGLTTLPILAKLLGLILLGFIPYAIMVWRSNFDPQSSFYGPITNMTDFLFVILRKGFKDAEKMVGTTFYDSIKYCGYFMREWFKQFSPLGFMLIVLGLIHQYRFQRALFWGLLLCFIGPSFGPIFLVQFNYDFLHQHVYSVYPLPSYAISALWLGYGLHFLLCWLKIRLKFPGQTSPKSPHLYYPYLLGGAAALLSLTLHWELNNRHQDRWAENYGRLTLESLPQNAIVINDGDINTLVLGYYHLVENVRPDLELYNNMGLIFNNRLANPIRGSSRKKFAQKFDELIASTQRPVVMMDWSTSEEWGLENFGFYRLIRKDLIKGQILHHPKKEFLNYVKEISTAPLNDVWENFHRNILMTELGVMVTSALYLPPYSPGDYVKREQNKPLGAHEKIFNIPNMPQDIDYKSYMPIALSDPTSIMGMVKLVLAAEKFDLLPQVGEWLKKLSSLNMNKFDQMQLANIEYFWGYYKYKVGQPFIHHIQKSYELFPSNKNPAHKTLEDYQRNELQLKQQKAQQLQKKLGGGQRIEPARNN